VTEKRVPAGLSLAAFVIAFLQHPGLATSDTKVGLHVNPAEFLGNVASVWSRTASLGHVQGGQYSGYLWPMGPFFWLGHEIGLSDWVVERLWLGALLALAAWGAVRLLQVLFSTRAAPGLITAGALYMLNPYVVVMTSRTTVFLLGYAALPWLLLAVHRGLRQPTRWWWPAAFALLVSSTAPGVNVTVTAFVLLGPILLAAYEVMFCGVSRRALVEFSWRVCLTTGVSSLWWVIPLLIQTKYGLNFLRFTEQVGSIWASTSLSESLRLMGYWPTYLGVGFQGSLIPFTADAGTMLFNPLVVIASLAVPALALGGFLWSRRRRYGPFLVLLALAALACMSVAWPDGTIGRRGFTFIYNHVSALQFLRTTYKAGPLLALAIALLAAVAISGLPRSPLVLIAVAVLVVLGALPIFEGRAIDLTWKSVPRAWTQAAAGLDRTLPANSRAVVLPGQAYAYYTWGGTVDPILPYLTRKPVAVRNVPPFDDLHAVDFLWTVDDLVQQQRLLPGELRPLLDLMSARAVITGSDDDTRLSGAVAPAAAARELAPQLGNPPAQYGPVRSRLPQVRRYDVPARGLVRIEPASRATVLDGSAQGVADLAALGELPRAQPLLYAGDEPEAQIRAQAAAGADLVITDSNRRRPFITSAVLQNEGWTVPADESIPSDAALTDPFASRGSDARTVAVFEGARDVTAPYNPLLAMFPEHRPFAAFDGDPRTAWFADTTLPETRQWVELDFEHPRDVPYLQLLPDDSNPNVRLTKVAVNAETFRLHPGWNTLPVRLRDASDVHVQIGGVRARQRSSGTSVGIAEIRIPGVRVRELLRTPVLIENAVRGMNLAHDSLTYVFERTTAAAPLQAAPVPQYLRSHGDVLQAQAALIAQAQDPESGIDRRIDPPAVRRWTLSGWGSTSPYAPDSALDALAGTDTRGTVYDGSGRFDGRPGFRASSAFDGSNSSAWVAPFAVNQPAWISWRLARPLTLRALRLVRSALRVGFPTRVSLNGHALPVGPGGVVRPRTAIRARAFVLHVLAAAGGAQAAVGIAEVRGAGTPAVTEAAASAPIRGGCGDVTARAGAGVLRARAVGSVAAFDAGDALRLVACRAPVTLPGASADVLIEPRVVRPLVVQLRSPAPGGSPAPLPAGLVTSSGDQSGGSYTGVRVQVTRPAWLVLGESYDAGWQASCNGHSLGPPRVIDAFANGWPVEPGCRSVSIVFGPQKLMTAGLLAGGLASAILLVVLACTRPGAAIEAVADPPRPRLAAWPRRPALAAGLVAAAVFGVLCGLRAGAVVGPVTFVILWRGVPNRRVILAAGGLLLLVPVLYVLFPGVNQGGYDIGYPSQHLGAHWVTVGGLALLALALLRELLGPVSIAA
jgi:hypothetical protein